MKSILPLLSAACAALLLASCSTPVALPKGKVGGYQTYRFYNPDVQNLPVFADREADAPKIIQQQIAERLDGAGLTRTGEDPELLVAHLIVVQDGAVSATLSEYYINSGSEILSAAHKKVSKMKLDSNFLAGTLVIDVIDIAEQKLVYRDYATMDIVEGLSDEERHERIRKVTDEALAGFLK